MATKINFKEEHLKKLQSLATKMLFENRTISGKLGNPLNVVELLHTLTPNQLNDIKASLSKRIEALESKDEWLDPDNEKLTQLKEDRELVNLMVGYKRLLIEKAEMACKKEELTKKLSELKESTKTPEDRIKELEAQLTELEEF